MTATATATLSTADIAAALDTTPRELRKYLRSADMGVGKGKRYALPATKRELNALQKAYRAWDEARTVKVDEVPTNDSGIEFTDKTAAENIEG